ncbi:MAG: Na/Pi cotransporter family protein [Treponema sp.]|jgi:phosphate:Na+ symporter|nr:Na/Pi cotransporter family protein [Treponema sp.]
MGILGDLFSLAGGLCLFLYGVKIMSDGVQQAAGDRLQKALNFMTGNRIMGVFTGAVVTTMVQSSSAVSVMLISFVNAGILSLTQAIGVIMGSNIGTTTTAWVVSLIGFKFDIAALALPALALGFIMGSIKWKHQDLGSVFMGFSFIFLGLEFLTQGLPEVDPASVEFIAGLSGRGILSLLIGVGTGTVVTLLLHSSAATITMIITLAFGKILAFDLAAAMILGANIGTTIDAILAAIGGKPAAKQTALVHVLFNLMGAVIVMILFRPFVALVDFLVPGPRDGEGVATHLAMFHSVFNITCTLIFLPFVRQIAALVGLIIKDKSVTALQAGEEAPKAYRFEYQSSIYKSPELAILRAEKEVQDLAGIASSMYTRIRAVLPGVKDEGGREKLIDELLVKMREQEDYADQMREELTLFFMECSRHQLNPRSEKKVSMLLRVIADLEELTDQCVGVSMLLERSVKKRHIFKQKEMDALAPFIGMVEDFLSFVRERFGTGFTAGEAGYAEELENRIDHFRNKLRKMGRKRIEAGEDVKTELLFIDLVKRIERLGDYCYSITEALSQMNLPH